MAGADSGHFTDQSAAQYRSGERTGLERLRITPGDIATARSEMHNRFSTGDHSRAYILAADFLTLFPGERPASLDTPQVTEDLIRYMGNIRRAGGSTVAEGYFHIMDEARVLLAPTQREALAKQRPSEEVIEARLAYGRQHGLTSHLPFAQRVVELAPELAALPSLQYDEAEYRTQIAFIQNPHPRDGVAVDHLIIDGAALKTLDPLKWEKSPTVKMTEELVARMNERLDYYRSQGKIDFFWTLARAMATLVA